MSLSAGTRVGPYEIPSALGAGGWARSIAPVIPGSIAWWRSRSCLPHSPRTRSSRERFDREARAISQLTHPRICTLCDLGEHDGTAFLVMELLDGETLADRLTKAAMPLDEALKIAMQIADALNAAHRRGIASRRNCAPPIHLV